MAVHTSTDVVVPNSSYFHLKSTIGHAYNNYPLPPFYNFGHVKKLELDGKVMFLWQDGKGNVCYCFDLLDHEWHTTTLIKLGNVISAYFRLKVEIVNTLNDSLKKVTNTALTLNKALETQRRRNDMTYPQVQSFKNEPVDVEELRKILSNDHHDNDIIKQENSNPDQPYHPVLDQDYLQNGITALTLYQLQNSLDTFFIYMSDLPVVPKIQFRPEIKQAVFVENGVSCKNSYIPSEYQIKPLFVGNIDSSFIIKFISIMGGNDFENAMKILTWLINIFNTLQKMPFALVLHSKEEIFMKLLSEEILEPFFNSDYFEPIDKNDQLDEKVLSKKLNEKVIYHFHNITTSTILNAPAKEFTNRLIHKDQLKINNKTITTRANILITSTSSYIPLIAKDVPSVVVNVESSLDDLCKEYGIAPDYYNVARLIKQDLDNFAHILRCLDLYKLNNSCQVSYDNGRCKGIEIIDGDVDPVEVFDKAIRNKDIVLFESLKTKAENLYKTLINDFERGRVDKSSLIDYFIALFGDNIYRKTENRKLLKELRKFSRTKEPFEDYRSHVRDGKAYYFLP